jgi:hypothetical protein
MANIYFLVISRVFSGMSSSMIVNFSSFRVGLNIALEFKLDLFVGQVLGLLG